VTRRIIRGVEARRDLVRHYMYMSAAADIDTARRLLQAIRDALKLLCESPELGSRREFGDSALAGLRMWPIRSFQESLTFYIPIDDGIQVVRVLHAKEDYTRILE